jgi:hypothetical protein
MFKRRLLRTIATVALVTGVLGAGPARAQAPLGFTIDPTQGLPGDTVTAQVNVAAWWRRALPTSPSFKPGSVI